MIQVNLGHASRSRETGFPVSTSALTCSPIPVLGRGRRSAMDIYLPLAETSANLPLLLLIGGGVGIMSGLFGVGGGFLLTPLLTLIGIPPAIAVASGGNQIIASSVSGVLAHLSRGRVDIELALIFAAGGLAGSAVGVWAFAALRRAGQLDLIVQGLFVALLGGVGALMMVDAWRAHRAARGGLQAVAVRQAGARPLADRLKFLPWRHRFARSPTEPLGTELSVLLPIGLGVGIGFLTAMMGVGGGFLAVPAMIYILGLPGPMVVGTSLLQIALTSAVATLLQAGTNQSVDIVLAGMLIVSGVAGAQIGARLTLTLNPSAVRFGLAALILGVAASVLAQLAIPPKEAFSMG
ncbi:MAG: sulfite exporter TauE/SafE family protein [Rhodospirillaceae bacterium]|nr:sulfite exporter TauE/SafE family protein [Rhodospirillaceae bacterium]